MSFLKIKAGGIPEVINAPSSKSYLNRALICGALKKEKVIIENINLCDDVVYLIKALEKIGLKITQEKNKIEIHNYFPLCEGQGCELEVGSGGTTLRFLLPLLALGRQKYKVILSEDLSMRPHGALINALKELGVKVKEEKNAYTIQGVLQRKKISIDASLSSQFASALTLLKVWDENFKVEVKNLKTSSSYLKMTEYIIEHFKTQNFFSVPGDFSSAAFPIVFACATNRYLHLNNLKRDPYQADVKILDVLQKVGVKFQEDEDTLILFPRSEDRLKSFEQDISDCLDLAPALAFIASFCDGASTLLNISALKYKESDRLLEIQKLLSHFNISYEMLGGDGLIIHGKREMNYLPEVQTAPDHRMVMTASLFLRALKGGSVSQSFAVSKSYPHFFGDLFH